MVDILSIGEILLDFISNEADIELKDATSFLKFPGGAPTNVVVVASALGAEAGIISRVGIDPFGDFLLETLKEKGVDVSQVTRDGEYHTGVVFVELKSAKPDFMLYTNVAYNYMETNQLNKNFIQNASVLNFGSVTLLMEPSRSTTFEAISLAKGNCTISCDVNFRLDLWKNKLDEMWELANRALQDIDILKMGYNEVLYIGSHVNPDRKDPTLDEALEDIYTTFNPKLIAVTMGGKGSRLILINDQKIQLDIAQDVYKVVARDTVGAGDAFFGSLLYMLHRMKKLKNLHGLTAKELKQIMTFCNTFAALSTTRKGAWNLPKIEDIMYIPEIKENYIK